MKAAASHSDPAGHWSLSRDCVFLNHGSFGLCPKAVVDFRQKLLRELDSQPLDFILRRYMPQLPGILRALEDFTGAQEGSIVLVPNATTGMNTILTNLQLQPGDQILITGQEYFASRNAAFHHAGQRGAEVVQIPIPLPVMSFRQLIDLILEGVSGRTRAVMVDHVSSPTGMVFPIERLSRELNDRGIDLIVDGAHGPGMLPLDLAESRVSYYAGNCHKWICSPKTSAILYVRPDRQRGFRPVIMSHRAEDFSHDLSPFQTEFAWNGTIDPTPNMTIPFTLEYMKGIHPMGWRGIMKSNRELAAKALQLLTEETGLQSPCPAEMLGSMGSLILPCREPSTVPPPEGIDPLQRWLREEAGVEIPVTFTSVPAGRFLRFSCQLYNGIDQYRYLSRCLERYLKEVGE